MFKNLFKRKPKGSEASPGRPQSLAADAMKRAIEDKRKEDPLIGAKIGSKEVVQRLLKAMKTEKGVHIESLLSALGSLAGYACQASVRAEFVQAKGLSENQVFVLVDGADGKRYFFGDLLNKPLAESEHSVWGLAAGAAQHLGSKELIDLNNIFAHVSQTVGGASFGIPRIPEGHSPSEPPIDYVRFIWPKLLPLVNDFCAQPVEWPILFGLAIQEVLYMAKGVIDPTLALSIVMESAIPMSKIDLATA